MTDKEKLTAIRAEIEKLYNNHTAMDSIEGISTTKQLNHLLSFIDSLPEESKNSGLEEEILNYNNALNLNVDMDYSWDDIEANVVLAARHFAEWGKKQTVYPVSQDLEEASTEYAEKAYYHPVDRNVGKADFIMGAQWHQHHMMKEAIEVTIGNEWGHPKFELDRYILEPKGIKSCDKVKIIILKDE